MRVVEPAWCRVAVLVLVGALGCKSDSPPTGDTPPPAEPIAIVDDAAPTGSKHWVLDSPRDALERVLRSKPHILGIGELHQLAGSTEVDSALRRFTAEMIDALAGRPTDLIVETWVVDPNCGAKEQAVVKEVKTAIQRPAETESELVSLLQRARALNMGRHVLQMSCADHASLLPDGAAEIDYWKLLLLVTERLAAKAKELHAAPDRVLVLYGGAHHNDRYPDESLAEISYVPEIEKLVGERYVELDLYVPELIAGNSLLEAQDWYPLVETAAGPDRVVLIERGPRSYILLMRKSKLSKSQPQNKQ